MNVLIIAAHPDDEVLGMGGTISKHTSQNDDVTIIYMATGITARRELLDDKHEIKNIPKTTQQQWQKEINPGGNRGALRVQYFDQEALV